MPRHAKRTKQKPRPTQSQGVTKTSGQTDQEKLHQPQKPATQQQLPQLQQKPQQQTKQQQQPQQQQPRQPNELPAPTVGEYDWLVALAEEASATGHNADDNDDDLQRVPGYDSPPAQRHPS